MSGVPDRKTLGATHDVLNQPPPFENVNLFEGDRALCEGLDREGAAGFVDALREFGATLGSARVFALGRDANRYPPELRTHDRFGHRLDEVAFHPAWHEMLRLAMAAQVHNLPWRARRPGGHVARSAMLSLLSQVESGSCCPITMTFACLPALRHQPELAAEWEPLLLGTVYDTRLVPA
ncbi:MAG TPA: DNA alkylation response protein, partial [Myxococcota bacterium]|nr:DNA alkylation response protein [Myxococcota bacterium]